MEQREETSLALVNEDIGKKRVESNSLPRVKPEKKKILGRVLVVEAGMRMAQSNQRLKIPTTLSLAQLPALNCAILGEIFQSLNCKTSIKCFRSPTPLQSYSLYLVLVVACF